MTTSVRRLERLELRTAELDRSRRFYTDVWGLDEVSAGADRVDLAVASRHSSCLALLSSSAASFGSVWFSVDAPDELQALGARVAGAGGIVHFTRQASGSLAGFMAEGPRGLHIGVECAKPPAEAAQAGDPSKPLCLTHVVLNSIDVQAQADFLVDALGFKVSDTTGRMVFLRCGADHHTMALAKGEGLSLNHAAYEMADIDGLMYGCGRLIEHGYPVEWGPGRHGPGNNVFCYFVDPDGFAVEYTTGMDQVDDAYVDRGPKYWEDFPRRPCRWGVARKPSERLVEAFAGRGPVARETLRV